LKNDIFVCLRATQGVSLWHVHVYICIITQTVHPLYFSPFSLSPLLMVISTGFKSLYFRTIRKELFQKPWTSLQYHPQSAGTQLDASLPGFDYLT
jgi:hypothetical protein